MASPKRRAAPTNRPRNPRAHKEVSSLLVETLVVLTIIGVVTACFLAVRHAFAVDNRSEGPSAQETPPPVVVSETFRRYNANIQTIRHDGHLWVVTMATYTNTVHHPDCPCHKRVSPVPTSH